MARRWSHFLTLLTLLTLGARVAVAQSTGTLTGRVTGSGGEALQGAAISVANLQRGAIVRADGSYQLTLPAGHHEVRVRLLGYQATRDFVDITAGATTSKNFTLEKAATSLEAVAILGTRGEERSVISAPAPIDVLSSIDIQQTGRVETAQMIQSVAPSFNFPRTTIGDGTDHIRPATLRGLAPDQALVLINGKRRHTSALVNLNGFVGRGSQAVDLNAIPASMIDHIEILRDGAAAQYGSDAIAGVMNIVLKTTATGSFMTQVGENRTTYNKGADVTNAYAAQMGERKVTDGKTLTSALNYGLAFGQSGYFQIGGEVRDRQGTNRTLEDTRQQYFTGDPRNASVPPQINHWQGDSYNHDTDGFFNAGTTFDNGIEVYAFGGLGKRHGASAGFWRRPLDDRTLRNIYPDGFLPFIKSEIWDGSVSGGLKGSFNNWKWDVGTVFGQNSFAFTIDNSANVSLGPTSKTKFDAGKLANSQFTTTLDLSREVTFAGKPLRIGIGGEVRGDSYDITAGEEASYKNGGAVVLDQNGQPTTRLAAAGSQVFPGFQPGDAGSNSRTNQAAYLDLESDLTSQFLLGIAGRVEHYSDFGSTSTGKVAARYEPVKGLAFRGTASTGFRAPSLGQEYFSSTATNFIGGVPFDIRTFPVRSAAAAVLGAKPLEPEKSVNFSGGVALEPAPRLAITVDLYQIKINNRIVLSDNFVGAAVQQLFINSGMPEVSGGRYFTNAIDTRSSGIDVVANYSWLFSPRSVLRMTSGYNNNTVKVTHVDQTPSNLSAFQEVLFGRVERTRIEKGNPRDNLFVSGNYTFRALGLNARTQRYGQVSVAGATPLDAGGQPLDQTYSPKWVTDLSAAWTARNKYTLTIGSDNIFDVYPDRNINKGDLAAGRGGLSNFGIFPYAGISPFGFNGRFVYTKLTLGF